MRLERIYRHPVKSVGAEALERVELTPDAPMPGDRAFAVAHGKSAWDPDAPAWMRCHNFVRVANVPALSAAEIAYDATAETIRCQCLDAPPLEADLKTEAGRADLADWVGRITGDVLPGPFRVARAPGATLTDSSRQTPSLMSLASLRALSEQMGADLDARRFRGNFWVDGVEPWAEFDLIGRTFRFGDVVLRVTRPIERCVATTANPQTGQRDWNPLPPLKRLHGSPDFGVLVEIVEGGTLSVGDVGEAQ